jgi:hypothetical protein
MAAHSRQDKSQQLADPTADPQHDKSANRRALPGEPRRGHQDRINDPGCGTGHHPHRGKPAPAVRSVPFVAMAALVRRGAALMVKRRRKGNPPP